MAIEDASRLAARLLQHLFAMKRTLAASACALLVLFASSASAEPIDIGSVGVKDLLIGGYDLGNSDDAEHDFLLTYYLETLGLGYSSLIDVGYQKIDIGGPESFVEVTGEPASQNLWALDFASFGISNPLIFLIRVGNAEHDHYLYQNLQSLQFGVVDLAAITAVKGNISISSISHTAVPEPATLSLLAIGIGVGVASRKRRKLA